MCYKLTEQGIKRCKDFIAYCEKRRKEILDNNEDTAEETTIPSVEDIESDISSWGVDDDGDYFNGWGVTDHNNALIALELGVDFVEVEE
jgi:hypothetical protein